MSFAVDQELYQDFLLEAGEILEQLGTFLVDLEQQPDDNELLNKVFRAFHNIKGGAGFLNLSTLVELCHCAEDIFNTLRQGARHVDADLMDAVLNALDVLNGMFEQLRNGEDPAAAEPALLERLHAHAQPATDASIPVADVVVVIARCVLDAVALAVVTDQEFEALLAALKARRRADRRDQRRGVERLLDELHGAGWRCTGQCCGWALWAATAAARQRGVRRSATTNSKTARRSARRGPPSGRARARRRAFDSAGGTAVRRERDRRRRIRTIARSTARPQASGVALTPPAPRRTRPPQASAARAIRAAAVAPAAAQAEHGAWTQASRRHHEHGGRAGARA